MAHVRNTDDRIEAAKGRVRKSNMRRAEIDGEQTEICSTEGLATGDAEDCGDFPLLMTRGSARRSHPSFRNVRCPSPLAPLSSGNGRVDANEIGVLSQRGQYACAHRQEEGEQEQTNEQPVPRRAGNRKRQHIHSGVMTTVSRTQKPNLGRAWSGTGGAVCSGRRAVGPQPRP